MGGNTHTLYVDLWKAGGRVKKSNLLEGDSKFNLIFFKLIPRVGSLPSSLAQITWLLLLTHVSWLILTSVIIFNHNAMLISFEL